MGSRGEGFRRDCRSFNCGTHSAAIATTTGRPIRRSEERRHAQSRGATAAACRMHPTNASVYGSWQREADRVLAGSRPSTTAARRSTGYKVQWKSGCSRSIRVFSAIGGHESSRDRVVADNHCVDERCQPLRSGCWPTTTTATERQERRLRKRPLQPTRPLQRC